MLLRRIMSCDEKRRLTHREFVEGAVGTKGETYEQLRQRILETITREELETQARVGSVLNAGNNEEEVYDNEEENGEEDEDGPMEDEELNGLFAALDSGALPAEAVHAIQKKIQRRGGSASHPSRLRKPSDLAPWYSPWGQ